MQDPRLETAVLGLHILAAACWFAPRLFWPKRIRSALASSEAAKVVVPAIAREMNFTTVSALVTIGTGVAIIFMHGGMKAVPKTIHMGLTLALVAFFAGLALSLPALVKIRAAVERGALGEAQPHVKKLVIGAMIEHTCWLATLVTMVWHPLS